MRQIKILASQHIKALILSETWRAKTDQGIMWRESIVTNVTSLDFGCLEVEMKSSILEALMLLSTSWRIASVFMLNNPSLSNGRSSTIAFVSCCKSVDCSQVCQQKQTANVTVFTNRSKMCFAEVSSCSLLLYFLSGSSWSSFLPAQNQKLPRVDPREHKCNGSHRQYSSCPWSQGHLLSKT